jgi:hypothetical protein
MQEPWLPCKIYVKAERQKPRRAYVVMHDAAGVLEPRWYVVLLIKHPSGMVLQVPGRVSRRRSRNYAEIYIPINAALSLAAQMGVKPEKNTAIYGYAARIKNVKPPPA